MSTFFAVAFIFSYADYSDAALDVLSAVSLITPRHVEETTLPLLFSSLPDAAPSAEAYNEHAQYRRILSNLTTLCVSPPLFETLVIRLSTKLDLICDSTTKVPSDQEVNAAYAYVILSSLCNVITKKIELCHPDIPKYLRRLVPRLYNLFIHASITGEQRDVTASAARHPRLIQAGAKVVQQIIQSVPIERAFPLLSQRLD